MHHCIRTSIVYDGLMMDFSRELNPLAELERHIQSIEDIFQVVSTLIELLDLGQGTPEVLLPDDACEYYLVTLSHQVASDFW